MLCVVADTNVYISAFNFAGPPRELFHLARGRLFALAISPPNYREMERVLAGKFGWPNGDIREVRRLMRGFVSLVEPDVSIDVVTEDPTDNRILECAVAARADFVVTGDGHLLTLSRYEGIPIITPARFLQSKAWEAR